MKHSTARLAEVSLKTSNSVSQEFYKISSSHQNMIGVNYSPKLVNQETVITSSSKHVVSKRYRLTRFHTRAGCIDVA